MKDRINDWIRHFVGGLLSYDTRPTEIMCSGAMFVYGFMLLLPFNTFSIGLLYSALSLFVSEDFFGLMLVILGLYGLFSADVGARKHASFANFLVYLFIAILVLATVPYTLGSLMISFVLGSVWCYIRLAKAQNG